MSDSEVTRPQVWVPSRGGGRIATHQSLYRELVARMETLSLEPGDVITVTFPREVYDSDEQLRDAERFCQQLANLVRQETGRRHQVVILKDGTEIGVQKKPLPAVSIEQID